MLIPPSFDKVDTIFHGFRKLGQGSGIASLDQSVYTIPIGLQRITSMSALVPPFTRETAIAKVRMAEDGWNSRNPQRVSLVYTEGSQWRNRAEFIEGRA